MAENREKTKSFKEAATAFGLKKATIDKLLAEDFDSLDTAKLLTTEDIHSLELTKGQCRLLEQWIATLSEVNEATGSSQSDGNTPDDVSPLSLLADDDLWDEEHIEEGIRTKNGRPFLINDFVSRVAGGTDEHDKPVFTQGGTQLIFRTNRQKPSPESVTLAQWISAESRIMAKLIKDGHLKTQDDMLSYLEYVGDFGDYAQVNELESVMLYDQSVWHV